MKNIALVLRDGKLFKFHKDSIFLDSMFYKGVKFSSETVRHSYPSVLTDPTKILPEGLADTLCLSCLSTPGN